MVPFHLDPFLFSEQLCYLCSAQVCCLKYDNVTLPVYVSGQGLTDLLGQLVIPAWAVETVKNSEQATCDIQWDTFEMGLPQSLCTEDFKKLELLLPRLKVRSTRAGQSNVVLTRMALPDENGPKAGDCARQVVICQ